jgi:hypothetical protein
VFNIKSTMKKIWLLTSLIHCLTIQTAHGNQSIPYRQRTPDQVGELVKQHQKNDANIQAMKSMPVLQDLPAYTGKYKFQRGHVQQTESGHVVYQVNLLAKENPDEVKKWYQAALDMWQWKTTHSSPQAITALHKDNHTCTIIINPAVEPGYATDIGIYYNQAPDQ